MPGLPAIPNPARPLPACKFSAELITFLGKTECRKFLQSFLFFAIGSVVFVFLGVGRPYVPVMGSFLSRFRKKTSPSERLAAITQEIKEIENRKSSMQSWEKKVVTGFVTYSIGLYVVAATVYFFFLVPPTPREKILYSCPVFIFPFLIYGMKRVFNWYYGGKLRREHDRLVDLYKEKAKVIELVMETETFKVARELLEKYAPEQLRRLVKDDMENKPDVDRSILSSPLGSTAGLRARVGPQSAIRHRMMTPGGQMRPPASAFRGPQTQVRPIGGTPMMPRGGPGPRPPFGTTPAGPMPGHNFYPRGPYVGPPPGPPLPRPMPARDRGVAQRLLDAFLGEGPGANYALICNQCHSHNGLAMKEEFMYLGWRCAYCHYFNPARKIKPVAPRLPEPGDFQRPEQPGASSSLVAQPRSESLPGSPRPIRESSVARTTSESNLTESAPTASTSAEETSEEIEDGGGDRAVGGEESTADQEEEDVVARGDGDIERQRAGEDEAVVHEEEEELVANEEGNYVEELADDDDGESGVDLNEGPSSLMNPPVLGENLAAGDPDNPHLRSPEEEGRSS